MSTITAVPLKPVGRRVLVYLGLGIALAVLAAVALAWKGDPGVRVTASGLRYLVVKPGTGPGPADGDLAIVEYVGTLPDGTVFDRTAQPTPLPVRATNPATGQEGVVPGFYEALKLMQKGGHYRIWIKPSLGYGAFGPPYAPPPESPQGELARTELSFDMTVRAFITQAQYQQIMMQQMMSQGGGAGGPGAPGAPGGPPPGR